jgi:hypothetical protein
MDKKSISETPLVWDGIADALDLPIETEIY